MERVREYCEDGDRNKRQDGGRVREGETARRKYRDGGVADR